MAKILVVALIAAAILAALGNPRRGIMTGEPPRRTAARPQQRALPRLIIAVILLGLALVFLRHVL